MQTTDETKASVNVEVELKPATAPRQLDMLGMLSGGQIGELLMSKSVTNKDGKVVGTAITTRKVSDIAKDQGLTGKANRDQLQEFIDKTGNTALRQFLIQISSMGDKFSLKRTRSTVGKDGLTTISLGMKEIKKKVGPSDEEIAKALGWTVEQVQEARGRQNKALGNAIDA